MTAPHLWCEALAQDGLYSQERKEIGGDDLAHNALRTVIVRKAETVVRSNGESGEDI